MAAHYVLTVPPGGQHVIRCRLSALHNAAPLPHSKKPFDEFDVLVARARHQADDFYKTVIPGKRVVVFLCWLHFSRKKETSWPTEIRGNFLCVDRTNVSLGN